MSTPKISTTIEVTDGNGTFVSVNDVGSCFIRIERGAGRFVETPIRLHSGDIATIIRLGATLGIDFSPEGKR